MSQTYAGGRGKRPLVVFNDDPLEGGGPVWRESPDSVLPLLPRLAGVENEIGSDHLGRPARAFVFHDTGVAYRIAVWASVCKRAAAGTRLTAVYPSGALNQDLPAEVIERFVDDTTGVVVWQLSNLVTAPDMAAMKGLCEDFVSVFVCDAGDDRIDKAVEVCRHVDVTMITTSLEESISQIADTPVIVVFDEELARFVQELGDTADTSPLFERAPLATAEAGLVHFLAHVLDELGGPLVPSSWSADGVTMTYRPEIAPYEPIPAAAFARALSAEVNVPIRTTADVTFHIPLRSVDLKALMGLMDAIALVNQWGPEPRFKEWAARYCDGLTGSGSTDPSHA